MASQQASRNVVVDDTDPSFIFTGTWGHDEGISGIASASLDKLMGPAYNNTSTFTESDSNVAFTFTGNEINIQGGINFEPTGAFGTCYIDGVAKVNLTDLMIGSGVVGTNNNLLCTDFGLSEGSHQLTIFFSGMGSYTPAPGASSAANRVWIDRAVYVPTAGVAMDEVPAIIVFPEDSQLIYSSGWTVDSDGTTQLTRQTNASVTFTFNGTSIDYYGTLLDENSTVGSTATYSIDGQNPSEFPLINFNAGTTFDNTPLFRSGTLPAGQHNLAVVYQGNNSAAALALDSLIFQPSSVAPSSSTNPTTSLPPTSFATASLPTGNAFGSNANPPHRLNPPVVAGIAIGVTGGFLLLLGLLLFFLHQRRRKQREYLRRTSAILGPEFDSYTQVPSATIPIPFSVEGLTESTSPQVNMSQYASYGQTTSDSARKKPEPQQDPDSVGRSQSLRKIPQPPAGPLSDLGLARSDGGSRLSLLEPDLPVGRMVGSPPVYVP